MIRYINPVREGGTEIKGLLSQKKTQKYDAEIYRKSKFKWFTI